MRPSHLTGKRTVRLGIFSIAAASAFALAACGSGANDGGGSSVLDVALSAAPTCLDPAVGFSANERAVIRPVVDSLVSMDKRGTIRPWLAKSWTVNENATAYTFQLKPGMTFSDGSPVDASAVEHTFDYLKSKLEATSARGRGYLFAYQRTKVVDSLTAEVRFSAPSVQFLAGASTTTLGIVSTSSAQKTPDQRCQGQFVGSGPYTLAEYTQGQSVALKKRTGYDWAPATAAHTGDASVDELNFHVVDTSNARAGALRSGQTHVAIDIATQDVPALKGASVTLMYGTQPGLPASFVLNTTRPGLGDLAVRKAMMIGFDRPTDVKAVLGARYAPATSIFTHNLPVYKDESSKMAFDAGAAEKLLDDSGWTPGPGGIRTKDGVKLDFKVTYTETLGAYYTSLIQLFQQQLKDIGIGIELNNLTQAEAVQAGIGHDFDIIITSLTDADPDIVRSSVALGLFPDAKALKAAGLTALFTRSVAEPDPAARKATYAKIQDLMIDNAFVIPFWEGGQLVGHTKDVHGLSMDFQSWLMFYDARLAR